jgi:hypothetical protein
MERDQEGRIDTPATEQETTTENELSLCSTGVPEPPKPPAVRDPEDETIDGLMATSAALNAALVMQPLQTNLVGANATAGGIMDALEVTLRSIQAGDMATVESMLLSQAMSLQTIYASLARRAVAQDQPKHHQTLLTLALKAQAQSRATLEALVEMKSPRHPATFVRQANIAHGPQQVNNGVASATPAGAVSNEQTRLLEAQGHERLDTGTQGAAGAGHPQLETVGAVNRSEND